MIPRSQNGSLLDCIFQRAYVFFSFRYWMELLGTRTLIGRRKVMNASKGNGERGDMMVSMYRLAWILVQAGRKVGVYWLRLALGVPMVNIWYFNMKVFHYTYLGPDRG